MQASLVSEIGIEQRNATRAAFLIPGIGISAWAPLVPFVKERAGLNEGLLGLLLLCIGLGSFVAMPVATRVAKQAGCRLPILVGASLIASVLPLLGFLSNIYALAAILLLFGMGLGAVEVVANFQAVQVEQAFDRPMMSGFHGMWSIGGIAGATAVSIALWLGLTAVQSALVISIVIGALIAVYAGGLIQSPAPGVQERSSFPRGVVLLLGGLSFLVFLAEGSVLDWSAVFLRESLSVEPAYAGLGYGAFAIAMTIGRLKGDRVVEVIGRGRAVLYGGLIAGLGFVITASSEFAALAILGFVVIGIGSSNLAPIFVSSAGARAPTAPGPAIAAVTAMGYSGVVIGPALVGFLAHGLTLAWSFIVIGLLFGLIAMSARWAVR
ncbi:MFS transporter [Pseudomonas sp. BP01]|uniref:MFS transporter n=1 Tax=Pseudomonas sp. BP01 TaxID=2976152 RepID=UPI001FAB3506|nr:MFS transporter [Pseudomonas sp. BP01]